MKRFFLLGSAFLITFSSVALAGAPTLPTLSNKGQLEDVGKEFAVNFAHTAVAAPETNGLWGIEIGAIGGSTSSPKLADLIDSTGEDGSKFKTVYHAGAMVRAHGPLDLFVEATLLPETKISDVTVNNKTFGLGWNAGAFFQWPLDVAAGINVSSATVSFSQVINNATTGNVPVDAKIDLNAKSTVAWLGASKTFLFATPYVKVGMAQTKADAKVNGTGTIFGYTANQSQHENVDSSGSYLAAGLNLQLLLIRLGFEASSTIGVSSFTGKLSFAF